MLLNALELTKSNSQGNRLMLRILTPVSLVLFLTACGGDDGGGDDSGPPPVPTPKHITAEVKPCNTSEKCDEWIRRPYSNQIIHKDETQHEQTFYLDRWKRKMEGGSAISEHIKTVTQIEILPANDTIFKDLVTGCTEETLSYTCWRVEKNDSPVDCFGSIRQGDQTTRSLIEKTVENTDLRESLIADITTNQSCQARCRRRPPFLHACTRLDWGTFELE